MKYRQQVGRRLIDARDKAEMEPEEIAASLAVKTNTYLRWERGERLFPMYRIRELSLLTGVSVIYLVTGEAVDFGWPLKGESGNGVETGDFEKLPDPTP